VRLVGEDVRMVLLRDIPRYGRVRLLNEVSVGATTTSQLKSLRIEIYIPVYKASLPG
jgi:hypothetical protein